MEERDDYEKLRDQINTDEQQERLKSLKDEEYEDAFEFHQDEIFSSIEDDGFHMEMIKSVSSAFIPDSEVSKETGYNFLFTEPLVEKGVKNFDVLLYNTESGSAVFIECKSSISDRSINGVLEDTEEAIEAVQENKGYLERQIGDQIKHTGFVIMTRATDIQSIKEREWNFENNESTFLWYIDVFQDKRIMIERSKGTHDHKRLAEKMKKGISVDDRRVDIELIYNTNNYRALKKVLIDILFENRKKGVDDHKEFDEERIAETLNDMIQMGASNKDDLIVDKAKDLEEIAQKCGVIKEGNERDYRIVSSYSKVKGIKEDIKNKVVDTIADQRADRDARERAVKRFRKGDGSGQQDLGLFSNS